MPSPTTWQEKAQQKRTTAAAKIPVEWLIPSSDLTRLQATYTNMLSIPEQTGLLTPLDIEITSTGSATALLSSLASQKYTAEEVTLAFCKRAAIAQQLVSCLTETFFFEALTRARALDAHLRTTGRTMGPLHGLPISLKDSFNIASIHTSLGLVAFLDRPPASQNSSLVTVLLAAGAVLYVKTNIPQTMMTCDSENHVFGRVLNPYRTNLTAGGSSGGEGALLALRGSILGVGTDVAGSIRIPALCCGGVGFKPSAGRVPYGGVAGSGRPGLVGGIPAVAGPMGHEVRDMELFMRTVCEARARAEDVDDGVVGMRWKLKIGWYREDASRPLHPNMARTMKRAVARLQGAGHTVVDITDLMPSMADANAMAWRLFSMDPDRTAEGHLRRSGEPPIASLKISYPVEESLPEPSLRELYDLNVRKDDIAARVRRLWLQNDLDVILAPGYQSCAVPHDTYGMPVYTVFFSLIDYPACVLPFGKADALQDLHEARDVDYVPAYKPEEVEGAPCHIQLVGRRMKDELLVQHAKVVEAVLRGGY
ncbi:amidase [Aspergillus heteromorphus CBS 117.55]|uniref:amidase n=1 Tax=Aspergillus heteromorphus CBS 117.55 TaxID=1448321 RepID=A0A317WE87_9EURO|nr:amidase [Aspergillus heteromorphus CBS 117.55]PWY84806.1 amidase [Aspergillus heteromorphus CBS 117.55]